MKEYMQSPCPLNLELRNTIARYNPKNKGTAYCFQLHDTLRVLYAVAWSENQRAYDEVLKTLQTHLDVAKTVKFKKTNKK